MTTGVQLITGGGGHIGLALAERLVAAGSRVVLFDLAPPAPHRLSALHDAAVVVRGDVSVFSQVLDAVQQHSATRIFHFAARLTGATESDPWPSMRANIDGTFHVLEAARLFGVERVMFASSIGTHGDLVADGGLDEDSLQRPRSLYGCQKLFGEGLGRWYAKRFGLDFRGLRYPQIVGPGIRTPGHWAPPMIEDALQGRRHQSAAHEASFVIPMYVSDAARAAQMLMDASAEQSPARIYHVTGAAEAMSAPQVRAAVLEAMPDARIDLADPACAAALHGKRRRFRDDLARRHWGWRPQFATLAAMIEAFRADLATGVAVA